MTEAEKELASRRQTRAKNLYEWAMRERFECIRITQEGATQEDGLTWSQYQDREMSMRLCDEYSRVAAVVASGEREGRFVE